MNRRSFLNRTAQVGLAALGVRFTLTASAQENLIPDGQTKQMRDKPNVIFIMADDMGYGDAGCYNADSKIPTPNIDRLARQGQLFTDAHSPSAVCSPTRYGLLTGRYAWRTRLKSHVLSNFCRPLIEPERLTLGGLFKENGYNTACIGKWHLGLGWQTINGKEVPLNRWKVQNIVHYGVNVDFRKELTDCPLDHGFDYFFGGPGNYQAPPYCFIENRHTVGIPKMIKQELEPAPMVPGPVTEDWKDDQIGSVLADKALNVIDKYSKSKSPFFLYFPLHAPHRPCVPSDSVKGKSKAGRRGDMIVEIDNTVGRIMQKLNELGIEKDTILIFTSDNGGDNAPYQEPVSYLDKYGHDPNRPWKGSKAQIAEGGHRVPFIVSWPGKVAADKVNSSPVVLTDMLASFAALLGYELGKDAGPDSHNVQENLFGQKEDDGSERVMIFHSVFGRFAIRRGKWKLVLPNPPLLHANERRPGWGMPTEEDPELFNLAIDPQEKNDLANEYPEIVKELQSLLQRIIKS
ncbi:Arylsulfatase [Limihaloglobus sulfuriphilus]|uniref:Arylsulfatase n=1 Tax=Limihaloglobus sulfuriphilus TaxID=1851148 RepID=A0A1Q2ME79_9BACT|nr:arylsulfatase [Limihaloglobus sulfuriphilus]AQQ71011.1 Arylsulfatase [Limihaloglobus sulfuriphilus]